MGLKPELLPLTPVEFAAMTNELETITRDLERISKRAMRAFGQSASDPLMRARAGVERARQGVLRRYHATKETPPAGWEKPLPSVPLKMGT